MKLLDLLSFWVSIVGIVIVVWGALTTVIKLLRSEYASLIGSERKIDSQKSTRCHLGSYILLGLEFMIAGDIIHTVSSPSRETLLILGATVAIRTVISYFLNKELEAK